MTGRKPKRVKQPGKCQDRVQLEAVMVGAGLGELLWEFMPLN